MSDCNNKKYDHIEINKIRDSTDECKVEIISKLISQNGIPQNFTKIPGTNEQKIFYEIKNGNEQQREWLLFLDNKFFCIYCVCFSPLKENRLVLGVEYKKNCRIIDKMKSHASELHHKTAQNAYSTIAASYEAGSSAYQSGNRNAIKCIVKIIIYIATHG